MANRPGAAGHRTEVVGVRLTPQETERYVDSRRGALSRSAYVRWVLIRAGDADPHRAEGAMPEPEEFPEYSQEERDFF
jgi:hypothetical protein